ncbi:MAG: hypothetical protein ABDH49_06875 [Candidatus Hydrothermales bacterium]
MPTYVDMFTPRQLLALLTFTKWVRNSHREINEVEKEKSQIYVSFLALILSQMAHYNCTSSLWYKEGMLSVFIEGQAIPMRWDFAEVNPFWSNVGTWKYTLKQTLNILRNLNNNSSSLRKIDIVRTSATELPYPDEFFDAIITDPPYYDNISYAALSDFLCLA